jgi:uncharacterized protein (DUF2384 family)
MSETASPPRSTPRRRRPAPAEPAWQPKEQTQFLIDHYGGVVKLAALFGVSKSQPSRWKDGLELPSVAAAKKILDLETVVRRALLLWEPDVARTWLTSPNAHFDNATPVDVVMARGASEVIEVLDAALAGAYA